MGRVVTRLCSMWLLVCLIIVQGASGQNLQVGFYQLTCPSAEAIVSNAVEQEFLVDNTMPASLIRLLFHDCFVAGCDASILLTGNNSEQTTVPNVSVRGYDVIGRIKAALELTCPGVVSCADVIVLAARDAVAVLGGPSYDAFTGRLDGLTPGLVTTLPAPTDGVAASTAQFANIGLSQAEMVTLLGAHTVGTSQCQFFSNRLFNFNNSGAPDPTLNATYAAALQLLCPLIGTGTNVVPLDRSSPLVFDLSYYRNARLGDGVLAVDAEVAANANTSAAVAAYAAAPNTTAFFADFVNAVTKLASVGLHTSLNGQVRARCDIPNS